MNHLNLTYGQALPRGFFLDPAASVARKLLGHLLVHTHPDGVTAGIIVETEAYDQTDPASHSFRGVTPRTRPMFAEGGTIYVYRSYGIHLCMNVASGPVGFGAAVLLRALEPVVGMALMAQRRGLDEHAPRTARILACGPGNLTRAMGITLAHTGTDACNGALSFRQRPSTMGPAPQGVATPRIGISRGQATLWRFILPGNPFISGSKANRSPP